MPARVARSAKLIVSGIALTLACAGTAHADPADDKRAEGLFSDGRAAMSRGDYASACAKFAESLKLTSRPSVTLNLAACEEHEGHLLSALDHWKKGAAGLPPKDERLPVATASAEALDKRIPRLTLKLPADSPPNARVTLDGAALDAAALGAPRPMDPGKHEIAISAPGRADHSDTFTLVESEQKEMTLSFGAPAKSEDTGAAAPPPRPASPSNKRTIGFVIGGIGVAGLIVGGVTGGILLSRDSTIKSDCPDKRCNQDGLDTISGSKSLIVVNAIAFGAGVVGVGLGAYLVLSSNKSASTTAMGPTVLPGGGGFALRHQF